MIQAQARTGSWAQTVHFVHNSASVKSWNNGPSIQWTFYREYLFQIPISGNVMHAIMTSFVIWTPVIVYWTFLADPSKYNDNWLPYELNKESVHLLIQYFINKIICWTEIMAAVRTNRSLIVCRFALARAPLQVGYLVCCELGRQRHIVIVEIFIQSERENFVWRWLALWNKIIYTSKLFRHLPIEDSSRSRQLISMRPSYSKRIRFSPFMLNNCFKFESRYTVK